MSISSRTTLRRRLLVGVAVAAGAFGIATAVQASIPDASGVVHACYNTSAAHGVPTGALRAIDTSNVNGNCASWEAPVDLASTAYVKNAQTVWSKWIYPSPGLPQADGHVAKFTFDAPYAGFATVFASIGVRLANFPGQDCHIQSQLAPAPAVLPNVQPGTTNMPGYTDNWINGNLPTELGPGTALEMNQSTSRVFPVVAGPNTIYLNGAFTGYAGGVDDCRGGLWGPISITATFAQSNPSATLTVP